MEMMNKAMRDLRGEIDKKVTEAGAALAAGDLEKCDKLHEEVEALKNAYNREEKQFADENWCRTGKKVTEGESNTKAAQIKGLAKFLRNSVRKDGEPAASEGEGGDSGDSDPVPQNMTYGDNGAIVPSEIADEIITGVKELCPILEKATMYHVKGKIRVPVYGDATDEGGNTHNINVAWAEDFQELVADAGKFTSIELGGYLIGALTLIGRQLINSSDIDLVGFVVRQMTRDVAAFVEGVLLNGDTDKNEGALETTNIKTTAGTTAVTTDELIELQAKVAQPYQKNACWTVNPKTLTAIRKLKYSGTGEYILQSDLTSEFPYRLLGKPVYVSENMPEMAASAKAVLYGDYSGLSVNMRESLEITVQKELFATQHAIGILAWMEIDSAVTDNQRLAVLQMAVS